jgi:hypothetical protein
MQEKNNQSYQERMIEAFVNKPEETLWYQLAFSKFNVNGIDNMRWHWSWWAFFSGFLFLLYRKQYIPALLVFIASMTIGLIPIVGGLAVMIFTGGYATYFIYKGYKKKLFEIEAVIEDEEKRIETMREIGGYNQWVVWVYALLVSLFFLSFLSAVFLPLMLH